ncbi:MAG: GNAT family N-acetyltransferase [Pseudomonadota bacterium]
MEKRLIEELSMNAWPAFHQNLLDGWVLRFARGFTKRSNSITPLYHSYLDPKDKIPRCEEAYARQGLPAIFRLLDFAAPPELDVALEKRGYRPADLTVVMVLSLARVSPSAAVVRDASLDEWMNALCFLSGTARSERQTHLELAASIAPRAMFAVLEDRGGPLAVGLGVLQNGFFGVFDILTHPERRRRGHGTKLVRGMLDWAGARGAGRAYLQVIANNEPARALYRRLGFTDSHAYWYRIQS